MFLLDTNAVSELMKPRRNEGYMTWYDQVDTATLHYSILTIAELRRGSLRLGEGPRRRDLERFIRELILEQGERVLPIGFEAADAWTIVGETRARLKLTVNAVDELIAATAIAHDLAVVTRNVRHFEQSGCRLLSPWSG